MAPLFSKFDLNKLRHDVQNEETLIYAKFGKDLFNISKVIGSKKVAQFFFDSQCIYNKKAQLSLTNTHDVKACQKLLQFDVKTSCRQVNDSFEETDIRCLVIQFLIQTINTFRGTRYLSHCCTLISSKTFFF